MDNWGPAFWTTLHIIAYQTTKNVNTFIPIIKQIIEKLPCESCIKDGLLYIKTHPLKKIPLLPTGEDISPFVWMCDFHNYVNRKLNKSEITWTDAYERLKKTPCQHCGMPQETEDQTTKQRTFTPNSDASSASSFNPSNPSSFNPSNPSSFNPSNPSSFNPSSTSIDKYEIRFVSTKNTQLSQKLNAQIKQ